MLRARAGAPAAAAGELSSSHTGSGRSRGRREPRAAGEQRLRPQSPGSCRDVAAPDATATPELRPLVLRVASL